MAITKLNVEVNNISALSDYPNTNEGMTSTQLKETFDKAGVDIKDYINSTLTEELDSKFALDEENYATKTEVDETYLKKADAEETYLTQQDASDTYLTQAVADSDYLKKDDASATYLTQTDAQNTYDTISNVSNTYATKQALAEAQMGAIVDQSVTFEKLSLEVQGILNNADTNIDNLVTSVATINGKIPSEASSSNQLADKNWVDGRVQENTANFIGRFDSVAELEAYAGTLTNNDYAYVVTQELDGTEKIVRYRYVASTTSWEEEFDMNNTIFTQSQLDTINSGIVANDKAKIENVSKYNIPSVEKARIVIPIISNNTHMHSDTSSQVRGTEYHARLLNYDMTPYSIEYKLYTAFSSSSWSSDDINSLFDRTQFGNGFLTLRSSSYISIDFGQVLNITINTYVTGMNNGLIKYGTDSLSNTLTLLNNTPESKTIETRYLYIRGTGTSDFNINYLYFDINGSKIEYQNQFTLDNNGTFTNNQRVLVETPVQAGNILVDKNTSFSESADHLTLNSSTVNVYADHFTSTRYPIGMFQDNNYWQMNELSEAVFDFKRQVKLKGLKLMKGVSTSFIIKYSNDNLTWNDITDITNLSTDTLLNIDLLNTNARYIKFYINTTSGYVRDVELSAEYIEGMSLDGVTSNTINNIPCDTLLQPSTKYELIYDETNNEFDLGKLIDITLFDITLTEAVNQVDLTGLCDKLDLNKTYMVDITGNSTATTTTSSQLYFGDTNTNLSLYAGRTAPLFFRAYRDLDDNTIKAYVLCIGNITTQLESNEYMKFNTPATKFTTGTRIIIKELS